MSASANKNVRFDFAFINPMFTEQTDIDLILSHLGWSDRSIFKGSDVFTDTFYDAVNEDVTKESKSQVHDIDYSAFAYDNFFSLAHEYPVMSLLSKSANSIDGVGIFGDHDVQPLLRNVQSGANIHGCDVGFCESDDDESILHLLPTSCEDLVFDGLMSEHEKRKFNEPQEKNKLSAESAAHQGAYSASVKAKVCDAEENTTAKFASINFLSQSMDYLAETSSGFVQNARKHSFQHSQRIPDNFCTKESLIEPGIGTSSVETYTEEILNPRPLNGYGIAVETADHCYYDALKVSPHAFPHLMSPIFNSSSDKRWNGLEHNCRDNFTTNLVDFRGKEDQFIRMNLSHDISKPSGIGFSEFNVTAAGFNNAQHLLYRILESPNKIHHPLQINDDAPFDKLDLEVAMINEASEAADEVRMKEQEIRPPPLKDPCGDFLLPLDQWLSDTNFCESNSKKVMMNNPLMCFESEQIQLTQEEQIIHSTAQDRQSDFFNVNEFLPDSVWSIPLDHSGMPESTKTPLSPASVDDKMRDTAALCANLVESILDCSSRSPQPLATDESIEIQRIPTLFSINKDELCDQLRNTSPDVDCIPCRCSYFNDEFCEADGYETCTDQIQNNSPDDELAESLNGIILSGSSKGQESNGSKSSFELINLSDLSTTENQPDEIDDALESWEDLETGLYDDRIDIKIKNVLEQKIAECSATREANQKKGKDNSWEEFAVQFAHVLEAYPIPRNKSIDDLTSVLEKMAFANFSIFPVDETHWLIVFPIAIEAFQALQRVQQTHFNDWLTLRDIGRATMVTRAHIRNHVALFRPRSVRRQRTTPVVARRLIENALGRRTNISEEQRNKEINVLKAARQEKEAQDAVWKDNA